MKYLLQLVLLVGVTAYGGPRYYGYSTPNLYGGQTFYSYNKTVIGQTRTDMRGGYRFYAPNKTYQGWQRGTNGKVYTPATVK